MATAPMNKPMPKIDFSIPIRGRSMRTDKGDLKSVDLGKQATTVHQAQAICGLVKDDH
ncbi:unnamed protein product [Prunus armeniaca]